MKIITISFSRESEDALEEKPDNTAYPPVITEAKALLGEEDHFIKAIYRGMLEKGEGEEKRFEEILSEMMPKIKPHMQRLQNILEPDCVKDSSDPSRKVSDPVHVFNAKVLRVATAMFCNSYEEFLEEDNFFDDVMEKIADVSEKMVGRLENEVGRFMPEADVQAQRSLKMAAAQMAVASMSVLHSDDMGRIPAKEMPSVYEQSVNAHLDEFIPRALPYHKILSSGNKKMEGMLPSLFADAKKEIAYSYPTTVNVAAMHSIMNQHDMGGVFSSKTLRKLNEAYAGWEAAQKAPDPVTGDERKAEGRKDYLRTQVRVFEAKYDGLVEERDQLAERRSGQHESLWETKKELRDLWVNNMGREYRSIRPQIEAADFNATAEFKETLKALYKGHKPEDFLHGIAAPDKELRDLAENMAEICHKVDDVRHSVAVLRSNLESGGKLAMQMAKEQDYVAAARPA